MSGTFKLNVMNEAGMVVARVYPGGDGVLFWGDGEKVEAVVKVLAEWLSTENGKRTHAQ
mgnify:CR=1 FL=1|jgi:hypothetical protein